MGIKDQRLKNFDVDANFAKEHGKKKGRFDFVPWSNLLAEAQRHYDEVLVHYQPVEIIEGVVGVTVRVRVTIRMGEETSSIEVPLAVTDDRNAAIARPNCGDIEKARQRALAKAIGMLTGIGLSVWAGDLQDMERVEVAAPKQDRKALEELFRAIDRTEPDRKKADRYAFISSSLGKKVTKDSVAHLEDSEVAIVLNDADEVTAQLAQDARAAKEKAA